ncbi:hypothetical protein Leryth_014130 [Lithospermum erythrorhizon]|nr:hypothetical protein Leryth_014130 [Lithospermum erythrorhizon]
MGKIDETQLAIEHEQEEESKWRIIFPELSLKCFFILLLSLALFFSTIFWILPPLHSKHFGFDANSDFQKSATVQAYFKLEKPVSELIPMIARLEYDINGEIGVPHTKVVVLSMHETGASNWTDVVFGFLPDPVNAPADPVSLAILKLSLIDLFLQQINLTLTNSSFGQTSSFEILEFPGGVSVVPKRYPWPNDQILFNFTLNNSMSEVTVNIVQLREQLRMGLHLMPDEVNLYLHCLIRIGTAILSMESCSKLNLNIKWYITAAFGNTLVVCYLLSALIHSEVRTRNVYVMLTNKNGSTRDPPITVEASITSVSGSLGPERLKQLAQNITRSPSVKNLGLNNTVFGKVKEVSLSSYLNHTIYASSPSPSPSPMPNDGPSPTPYTWLPPSYSPSPSTSFPYPPDGRLPRSPESEPPFSGSPTPVDSHCGNRLPPSPSPAPWSPDLPPFSSSPPPTNGRTSQMSPAPSPLLALSYGSNRVHQASEAPPLPSQRLFHKKSWWFCIIGVLAFHLAWSDPLMWR